MRSLKTYLLTAWIWIIFSLFMVLITIPLCLFLLLPQRFLVDNTGFRYFSRFFHWFCIKASLLPISYRYTHELPNTPCIIVANHQSSYDIPLIGFILNKRPHVWLAWAQLHSLPLLKPFLKRVALLVDVSSPITAARSLLESIALLKKKPWDLILFPEGARYTDGNVHPFFNGFATIARKTNRSVVPIKIIGVNTVYPPHTWIIQSHPIQVIIGPTFKIEENETDEAFKQRVYNWFITT